MWAGRVFHQFGKLLFSFHVTKMDPCFFSELITRKGRCDELQVEISASVRRETRSCDSRAYLSDTAGQKGPTPSLGGRLVSIVFK